MTNGGTAIAQHGTPIRETRQTVLITNNNGIVRRLPVRTFNG